MSRLVTTAQAAAAVGRPPATLRTWAARGLLRQYAHKGTRMYRVDEVQRVDEAMKTRKLAGHMKRMQRFLDTPTAQSLTEDSRPETLPNVSVASPNPLDLSA